MCRDQKIYTSKAAGMVVTRVGGAADPQLTMSGFDEELWQRIMAAAPAHIRATAAVQH